jgi:deferrochelatase/peroxidase EfeB
MSTFTLPPVPGPRPLYSSARQHGITDPMWPVETPDHVRDRPENYDRYRGRVDLQGFLTLIRADTKATTRAGLEAALRALSGMAYEQMARTPDDTHVLPLEPARLPKSYRVTITIGLGATLFTDRHGRDRFGIRALCPRSLKIMPSLPKDRFDPVATATDVLVQVCSDHEYVNVYLAQQMKLGALKEHFTVTGIERGFARPDLREHLGFDDGIANLRAVDGDPLHRLVYVDETCHEPAWCVHGAYLVYRKIRENLPVWEAMQEIAQEQTIGRRKASGEPLAAPDAGNPLLPDFSDDPKGERTPFSAHVRKVQPRRRGPDLFGIEDLERRFHRRPYPYFDGQLDAEHEGLDAGLHFLGYMRSIRAQFEHVATMWQLNPNFPHAGAGIDQLYGRDILSTVDGGYYFCPPGTNDPKDFVGSGLFRSNREGVQP